MDRFSEKITWDSVVRNGHGTEVAPLLSSILEKIDTKHEMVSHDLRKRLKNIYYQFMVPNMFFHHHLATVLSSFQDAAIKVMVLKGAALAETVYGNIALRPMRDIDLLVSQRDLDKAKDELLKLGFRKIKYHSKKNPLEEHPFYLRFVKGDERRSIIIDLQWNFTRNPFNFEVADLMERAIMVKISGMDVHVMCPDDLLLHLCWHTAKHYFLRVIWLCDIAQVIKVYGKSINWDNIIEISERWKIRRAVYYSLFLAKNMLGARVPEKVALNFQASNFETRIFRFVMINMEYKEGIIQTPNPFLITALKLLIIERPKDRLFFFLKCIWNLFLPGVPYIRDRYSISRPKLARLYQFLRPFILVYKSILRGLEIIGFGLRRYRKSIR